MALASGTRLGPYEITAQIGVGGMGEVYRATDTTLNRQVAVKVLPESLASDAERIARFEREAKTLASLNHPNIAQIYGFEKSSGVHALVMELVEGPTLENRIAQGAIPVDEALPIAKQIAEALEAAHEQGIIHRDLKPANVKLRPDGVVKVLDFGLAKALEPTGAMSPGMSQAPTITTPAMTQAGMILGTAAYMSPEQAKGRTVDKRSDVWAFGAVLYEMLSGQRAFGGDDISETLADVMRVEPAWDTLPKGLSPSLTTFLKRCLQKDPKQRVPDIASMRLALEGAFETTVTASADPTATPHLQVWQRPFPAAIVVLAALVVGGFAVWALTGSEPVALRVERFAIPPPAPETVGLSNGRRDIAISPDGSKVVYSVTGGDPFQLFVRSLDALTAMPLQGLDTLVYAPFVSPDGAWVGFYSLGETSLKKVSILGGPPVTICNIGANILGADWAEDDTIIFGTDLPSGLWRVSANGGEPEELSTPDAEQGVNHGWPHVLPGGRAVLFTVLAGGAIETAQIALLNLETGDQRVLVSGGSAPQYAPTGHIVYSVGGTLRAVGFDLDRLDVTNPNPVPVLDGVGTKVTGAANFDLAQDGSLVYVAGGAGLEQWSLVWVSRDGREEPVAADPASYQEFTLSPDGTRMAVRITGDRAVWIYDLVRDTSTRLTFESDAVGALFPTWTPDGTRVAFGPPLSWKRADGIRAVEGLDDATLRVPQAFSPDGTMLVFEDRAADGGNGLGVLTLEGDRTATLVIDGEFFERNAALSPDGRWVAYNSNETGERQVYVQPFPGVDGGKWQISTDGGEWPVWNPAGNELFYRSPTGVMVLAFETEPTFTPGALTQLFERTIIGLRNRRMAVSPDGERFLLLANATVSADSEAAQSQVIVVQNWHEELKRLVPVD